MLRYVRYGYKGTYLQSQYLEAQEVNCFEFKTNLDGASLKIKPNQKVASTDGPETLSIPWFPGAWSQHGREGHYHMLLIRESACLHTWLQVRRKYLRGMPAMGATHWGCEADSMRRAEQSRTEQEYSKS